MHCLCSWFSKCGPQMSSSGISGGLVRNAALRPTLDLLTQKFCDWHARVCVLTSPLGVFVAH